MPEVSFEDDIRPLFEPYVGAMKWRFDLTDYDHVRANADVILYRLQGGGGDPMPPATAGGPIPIMAERFKAWMDGGYKR